MEALIEAAARALHAVMYADDPSYYREDFDDPYVGEHWRRRALPIVEAILEAQDAARIQ